MNYVPAEQVVHPGLFMTMKDVDGAVIQGVVHAVVMSDDGKPTAVLLTTPLGVKTMYLKGVELHKHWTVH